MVIVATCKKSKMIFYDFQLSKITEKVKISELHQKAHMLSLEQRMRKQLLWLMYIHSLNHINRKICPRLLRSNDKYIFKTDRKIGTKYQNSTLLWNDLPVNIQFADTVGVFKQQLRPSYKVYVNLPCYHYNDSIL